MHGCRSALAMTAAALALAGAATSGAEAKGARASQATEASVPRTEAALLREMNRARAERGRRPLRMIATLRRPARAHSRYLVRTGGFDHDGRGGAPFWKRLFAAGFPRNRTVGENLAMVWGCGSDAARQTVRMWLDSPPHRANLLNPRFRWVGTGSASAAGCSSTILTADYGS